MIGFSWTLNSEPKARNMSIGSRHAGTWLLTGLTVVAALLSACAPRGTPVQASLAATQTLLSATSTQTATELPQVATPRGDRLEATDPSTVTLASGGLQLIEFFAFW